MAKGGTMTASTRHSHLRVSCLLLSALSSLVVVGCFNGDSMVVAGPPGPPPPDVTVTVSPTTVTVVAGGSQVFRATITGTTDKSLNWRASGGTTDELGLPPGSTFWTAPAAAGTYTITATSRANSLGHATATATVVPGS